MKKAVLHLGSNVGSASDNLDIARILINKKIGIVDKVSYYYKTSAWGKEDQADFINAALIVYTDLSPEELLKKINEIEKLMGRRRIEHWGPRIIDIDIIFYESEIIKKANLKIPHPEISNRNFVLIPLLDICPDMIHPVLNKTVKDLHQSCRDNGEVIKCE